MRYTLEQRIFMYEEYIKHKSFVECCVGFIQKYPGVRLPRKSMVRKLVTKFRKTGSLLDETEEVDKRQKKILAQNKQQTSQRTLRPVSRQRRSGGPVTRAITRDIKMSGGNTPLSHREALQETDHFTFVGMKCEVADDIIDLESDSDSDMQEPSLESRIISVKEEPPDTSSCESSDSDFKKEDESEMGVMEGESGSDSNVKEHCDESQLICVKEEPPDATGSASSDDEVGQEQLTHVTVKQEVRDDTYVNGVQSDLGATEQCHSDTLQVPTATSSCPVLESRAVQEQVMFTSVKVKCEVKDEIQAKESPR